MLRLDLKTCTQFDASRGKGLLRAQIKLKLLAMLKSNNMLDKCRAKKLRESMNRVRAASHSNESYVNIYAIYIYIHTFTYIIYYTRIIC